MSIKTRIRNLKKFRKNLNVIIGNSFKENEHILIDANVEDQLFEKGIDNKGEKLLPYSPITIKDKKEKGQPTNRTTTRDTGKFHASFFQKVQKLTIEYGATDSKAGEIIERYGDQIYGLTDENLSDFIHTIVKDDIIKAFRAELRKG